MADLASESFHKAPPTVLFTTADEGRGKLVERRFGVKPEWDFGRLPASPPVVTPLEPLATCWQRLGGAAPPFWPRAAPPGRLVAIPSIPARARHWREAVADAILPRVIPVSCSQVEVHVFRRRGKRLEMLLIRRSPHRSLAGVWQPVTGGIERGESVLQAAAREVREETGLTPLRWWALEHIAVFYEPAQDRVRVVPVFAAEVAWTDPVLLSDEHDRYAFVPPATARRRVLWATQRRAIAALLEEVVSGSAGGAARDVTARIAALATRPAARTRPTRPATRNRTPAPARRRRRP